MPRPNEIRAARKSAGLTQAKAAVLADVDRVTWARYECGMRPMSDVRWRYFLHRASIKRIPFKTT